MIKSPDRLRRVDAEHTRAVYAELSYLEALQRFESLWLWARRLQPSRASDWRIDLEPVFAVARAINGLPPKA